MTKQEEDDAINRIYGAADSCSPDDLRRPILEEIRRAVEAEREACARTAETWGVEEGQTIAELIRMG